MHTDCKHVIFQVFGAKRNLIAGRSFSLNIYRCQKGAGVYVAGVLVEISFSTFGSISSGC